MTEATPAPMGILERRRIEAEIIRPIYAEMKATLGEAAAQAILSRAIRAAAVEAGRDFAAGEAAPTDLDSFRALLPLWTKHDALEIAVRESTPERFDYDVTRCRYAEMYRAMGLGEIGHLLSCNRDGAFCEGYDPRIRLTRTQTIMGGASHCDFRYRFEADAEGRAP
jgi:hypothetical protein